MADLSEKREKLAAEATDANEVNYAIEGEVINASGHRDQLQRGYGFFSICGLALNIDIAWIALGSSLLVAICRSTTLFVELSC